MVDIKMFINILFSLCSDINILYIYIAEVDKVM
jgi:hypothetical protein